MKQRIAFGVIMCCCVLVASIRRFTSAIHLPSDANATTEAESTQSMPSPPVVFQPKMMEAPSDEEYGQLDDYYEYETNSDYTVEISEVANTNTSNGNNRRPDALSTTKSTPKWTTKNSTAPSKFNLNSIFDFVEYILRPTNSNENTVESSNRLRLSESDLEMLNSSDYLLDHEYNQTDGLNDKSKPISSSTRSISLMASTKNESLSWYSKENVCQSKVTYQREARAPFEYWYMSGCRNKFDSEFCVTNIQAGHRGFEIHSTVLCCPNYQLDTSADTCVKSNNSVNLYNELKSSMRDLLTSVRQYFYATNETTASNRPLANFYAQFEQLRAELLSSNSSSGARHTNNMTRYTVYLWDSGKFVDYVASIMAFHDYNLQQKLDKIMSTLRNHIAKLHYATQSIANNNVEVESLAGKRLRLSTMNMENRSLEFVNCRELKLKNQYYASVADSTSDHNYRLLIHRLQPGSLLIPFAKTVLQVLTDKVLKPTISTSPGAANTYSVFQQLFTLAGDSLTRELAGGGSTAAPPAVTVFVPTDAAFSALRVDQLNALRADRQCAQRLLAHNIVREEVCPSQLLKHGGEHASAAQRAHFIAVSESGASSALYFNGQLVSLSKSMVNSGANGMIYRLATLKLTGVVEFLYDVVVGFKKKFPAAFLHALDANWLDVIKNESTNTTLLMPFEDKLGLVDSSRAPTATAPPTATATTTTTTDAVNSTCFFSATANASSYCSSFAADASSSNTSTGMATLSAASASASATPSAQQRINISDYMIRPRVTFYELNDGDLLTSVSGKRYRVSAYAFASAIPENISFIPERNFQRKAVNCMQLEVPDLSACGAQLIVFRSSSSSDASGTVLPELDTLGLLEYIAGDRELSIFNNLLAFCGDDCRRLLNGLASASPLSSSTPLSSSSSSSSSPPPVEPTASGIISNGDAGDDTRRQQRVTAADSLGYTLLLPTNRYFAKAVPNFSRFARNMSLFRKTIQANVFLGAQCYFHLRMDVVIENLLGRRVKSKRVYARITKPHAYMAASGILVHKTETF